MDASPSARHPTAPSAPSAQPASVPTQIPWFEDKSPFKAQNGRVKVERTVLYREGPADFTPGDPHVLVVFSMNDQPDEESPAKSTLTTRELKDKRFADATVAFFRKNKHRLNLDSIAEGDFSHLIPREDAGLPGKDHSCVIALKLKQLPVTPMIHKELHLDMRFSLDKSKKRQTKKNTDESAKDPQKSFVELFFVTWSHAIDMFMLGYYAEQYNPTVVDSGFAGFIAQSLSRAIRGMELAESRHDFENLELVWSDVRDYLDRLGIWTLPANCSSDEVEQRIKALKEKVILKTCKHIPKPELVLFARPTLQDLANVAATSAAATVVQGQEEDVTVQNEHDEASNSSEAKWLRSYRRIEDRRQASAAPSAEEIILQLGKRKDQAGDDDVGGHDLPEEAEAPLVACACVIRDLLGQLCQPPVDYTLETGFCLKVSLGEESERHWYLYRKEGLIGRRTPTFVKVVAVIALSLEALASQRGDQTQTLRWIFYEVPHLFHKGLTVGKVLAQVYGALTLEREMFGWSAGARSQLAGNLTMQDGDKAPVTFRTDMLSEIPPKGKGQRVILDCEEITNFIIVEKESTALEVVQDGLAQQPGVAVLTSKGFPDHSSRHLIAAVAKRKPSIEFWVFVDNDFGGLQIYERFRDGSFAGLSMPKMRLAGLLTADPMNGKFVVVGTGQPFTLMDLRKANNLKQSVGASQPARDEAEALFASKTKRSLTAVRHSTGASLRACAAYMLDKIRTGTAARSRAFSGLASVTSLSEIRPNYQA